MQPLDTQSNQANGGNELVGELLSTIFPIMDALRNGMRSQRPADLTEPQFRTMGFLCHNEGISLSGMAEEFGLTLPTVSKMVDGLVKRELVLREENPRDRRRVTLRLTEKGRSVFEAAKRNTNARLAEMLGTLTPDERAMIVSTLQIMRRVFAPVKEIG